MRNAVLSFALGQIVMMTSFAPQVEAQLLISEYIEGTSNNKALEIWNAFDVPVNFVQQMIRIQVFANGSASATATVILPDFTLGPGDVFVVAHPSATFAAVADQTSTSVTWTGNDAVVLRAGAGGTILDSVGRIGEDPAGGEWGSGSTTTANHTLRRDGANRQGDSNPADSYDPAVQFVGFPQDDASDLGIAPVPEPVAGCLLWGAATTLLARRKGNIACLSSAPTTAFALATD